MKDLTGLLVTIFLGVTLALLATSWLEESVTHGNEMCQQTPECASSVNQ